MPQQIDRRGFMVNCATATAMAAGMSKLSSPASAIDPIVRNGTPKFKFSLAAYSYRDLLTGDPPQLTLADFIDDCAKMGLEGTELTSYYFPEPTTYDYVRTLKQQCFKLGLDVSGTAIRCDFGYPAAEERRQQVDWVKRWIDYSEALGAPVIRIFAGYQKEGVSPENSHSLMVTGMEECCDYAGQHGVHLALENHGGPTATADGMLAFVRDVQSSWFGVNFDTGNFSSNDPYGDLAKLAPYALNVQVKVMIVDPNGKKEPSDFARLAQILRDVGYRGYIVLEYEEAGDPRVECPKYIRRIRDAFA
jgi:sugar phosphate isomerase/epimerase